MRERKKPINNIQGIILTAATGLLLGGAGVVKAEPNLITIAGSVATTGIVLVKQNELKQQLENQLVKHNELKEQLVLIQEVVSDNPNIVQKELEELNKQLEKQEKQLEKQEKLLTIQQTRSRLAVDAIQKLQHSNKANSGAIALMKQQLNELNQKPKTPEPAKTSKVVTLVPPIKSEEPVTRVYIDGNNLKYAMDKLGIELDYQAFKLELAQGAAKTTFKYYTGVHKQVSKQQEKFFELLNNAGYEVKQLPILKKEDGSWKTVGDDMQLGIHMAQETRKGDSVILVSNDGDFIPAVKEVQAKGVEVTIVGQASMLNSELRKTGDKFISLDEIKYNIAKLKKLA